MVAVNYTHECTILNTCTCSKHNAHGRKTPHSSKCLLKKNFIIFQFLQETFNFVKKFHRLNDFRRVHTNATERNETDFNSVLFRILRPKAVQHPSLNPKKFDLGINNSKYKFFC